MQALSGDPSKEAQMGLKSSYKIQGYVLTCQWRPEIDVEVKLPKLEDTATPVEILTMEDLCYNVMSIRLKPQQPFECIPGQYINLVNPDKVARSYSIANQPNKDGFIELHIKIIPDGKMSQWLKNVAKPGVAMNIRGPAGTCVYAKEESLDYPIILAGTGTGLAPLYGILSDALAQGHTGPIRLFHGGLKTEDMYFVDRLRSLENSCDNFTYTPCVLNGNGSEEFREGNIENIVISELPKDKETRAFICGVPELVNSLRKKVFLAGLASKNIHADAFLTSQP